MCPFVNTGLSDKTTKTKTTQQSTTQQKSTESIKSSIKHSHTKRKTRNRPESSVPIPKEKQEHT